MAIDRLWDALTLQSGTPRVLERGAPFLDGRGFFGPLYSDPVTALVQIDGSVVSMGSTFTIPDPEDADETNHSYTYGLDLSRPGVLLVCRRYKRVSEGNRYEYRIWQAEPRTGHYFVLEGEPVEFTESPIVGDVVRDMRFVGALEDRYLFVVNEGVDLIGAMYSFPRSPLAVQEFTHELFLPILTTGSGKYTSDVVVSAADMINRVWLSCSNYHIFTGLSGQVWTAPLLLYNTLTKEVEYRTGIRDERLYPYSPVHAAWSRNYGAFFGYGHNSVYVFSPDITPVSLSAPEIYDPHELAVVSISATNPAVIEVRGNVDAWMQRNKIQDGDYINFGDESLFYGTRLTNEFGATIYSNVNGIAFSSLPITYVDYAHFSVPIDGALIANEYRTYYLKDGADRYLPGTVEIDTSTFKGSIDTSHPVRVYGYPPPYDAVNDVDAEVVTTGPEEEKYLQLEGGYEGPYTSDTAIRGYIRQFAIDGKFHPRSLKVSADRHRTNITKITLSNPIKITVGDPEWLDIFDVATTAQAHLFIDSLSAYSLDAIRTITRVAADAFTYVLDGTTYASKVAASVTAEAEAKVTAVMPRVMVGDKVKFDSTPSNPVLNNVVATVLSVISGDSSGSVTFSIDVDTSAMGGASIPMVWLYESGMLCRRSHATLMVAASGYGIPVRTRVTGSEGEACVGVDVAWSVLPSGQFEASVSRSDDEGYASTIFYPEQGVAGDYTITATTEWI